MVVCSKHGEFDASHSELMQDKGCRKCGIESGTAKRSFAQERAISLMKTAMPQFDYSRFVYKGSGVKSTVICSVHGEFPQSYAHILNGTGCSKCSFDKVAADMMTPYDEFLKRAKHVHGEKYTYKRETYKGMSEKMIAVCKVHGDFALACGEHTLKGQGCPSCKDKLFNPSKPAHLYICRIFNDEIEVLGYGITVNIVRRTEEHKNRLASKGLKIEMLQTFRFKRGYYCREAENEIKSKFERVSVNARGFKR